MFILNSSLNCELWNVIFFKWKIKQQHNTSAVLWYKAAYNIGWQDLYYAAFYANAVRNCRSIVGLYRLLKAIYIYIYALFHIKLRYMCCFKQIIYMYSRYHLINTTCGWPLERLIFIYTYSFLVFLCYCLLLFYFYFITSGILQAQNLFLQRFLLSGRAWHQSCNEIPNGPNNVKGFGYLSGKL